MGNYTVHALIKILLAKLVAAANIYTWLVTHVQTDIGINIIFDLQYFYTLPFNCIVLQDWMGHHASQNAMLVLCAGYYTACLHNSATTRG